MRTLDFAINKAIDAQAQASCLALTGRMHTTLPRELRDLVYDELVDMDSFAARLRARLEAQDAPLPSGPASHPRPHWMSHLFVTGPVLDEMIHRALWQLKRRPYDATQTVTCRFDAFLEREVEDGTGFLPRDIFPNLRIEISPRKLNQLWRDEQGVGPSHQDPRFADAAGEMLERIPRRPGETLHILISEQMVRKWEMAWMRPAIEKMLGRVREALGGKVTVEWANVKTKALLDGAVVVFPLTAKELERDDVCFCPFD
ncbi:hypothetical protein EJ04DRAFT_59155 [Polyplosphaeria fusca]|uniref:Uncharacterized protein n=1 Tax=Polyplosphaeria fusca TaxID=682080 RepID=A0A9P4UWX7_9PLEO|nr:hypothetical protein EJ04DRAFT_59155 [Polyplosphaeria fusca]